MKVSKLRLLSVLILAAAVPALAAPTFTQTAGGPETSAGQVYRRASDGALYSLVSDRLYKSTSNGSNWTLATGYPASLARGLAFSGTDLYASGVFGVALSTNDGTSWSSFNGSGNGALPIASVNQVLVAGSFIYAYGSDGNFQSHLYRSATGSASWSDVTPPNAAANGIDNIASSGSNICVAVSNNGIRWSANNGDSWNSASGANGALPLMAPSATDANTIFVASTGGGVLRSTNSCQAFSSFGSPLQGLPLGSTITGLGTDITGTAYVGLSNGTLRQANATGSTYTTINGGTLPAATGVAITSLVPVTGGVLAGTTGLGLNFGDGTTSWVRRGSGLKGGAVYALDDRGAASQFAASSGGVLFTADGGTTYAEQNNGLNLRATGSAVHIGANYLVAAFQANNGQGTAAPGLFRSGDSGATWTQLQTSSGLPADANVDQLISDGTNFYAALSFSKGLYTSTDGASWTAVGITGLPANPGFRNLAVRGTTLWAYVANSGVYRSIAGGAWENVTHELSGEFFGKVFATAHSLIASAGGVVYRSLNDGDSWTATSGFAISRFGIEILSLAEDSAQVLYLGDEHAGLSVSKDGGATWTPSSDGLATSAVCIERIQALLSKDGKIYAAQGAGGGVRAATAIGGGAAGDGIGCTTSVDTYPNNFSFAAQNNVAPDAEIHTNVISISGLGSGVSTNIRVVGGAYSLSSTAAGASSNCTGPFVTTDGQVHNGSLLCLSQTSSSASETGKSMQVFVGDATTLGEVSALFSTATGLVFTGRTDEINTSYGSNGFAHMANVGQAADVKVLADGSVILATQTNSFPSDIALVKFKPDGTADTAFGTGGKATISVGGSANTIAVIVLPSGKLLAVANANIGGANKIAIARFTSSGQPDTFGTNGVLLYDTPVSATEGAASALALAGDAFMIGGHLTLSGNGAHLFVAKFAADGTPDSSFGSSGLATIQIGSSSATGGALALQADGKIVAVGQGDIGFNTYGGVLVRFTSTGTADSTFGTGGKLVVNGAFSLLGVAVLSGGNIMAVGQAGNPFMPVVVRITSAGALDTTYDGDGVFNLALTGNSNSGGLVGISVLANGSIAVTGSAFQSDISTNVLLFGILKSDGTLDANFGPGGQGYLVRRPVNGSAVLGPWLQQRSDGGVVIGGLFGNEAAAFVYGGQAGAPPADTTPGPFDFTDQNNVEPLATVTSNTVTITDINKPATIHVTGGKYSVGGPLDCGSTFVSTDGTVSLGQKVCLQHTAAMAFGGTQTTTVNIGSVIDTFTSTVRAGDAVPNDFVFVNKTDVPASSVVTSAPVAVSGFEVSLPVTVSGGTFAIIASDATACGNTFGTTGNISSGQKVCARHTSSATAGGITETTVTIGGKSATFRSTTFAPPPPDTTPNAFHFTDVTGVALSTAVVSNSVIIDGIDAAASVTVENGEYSIGAGDCNGQSQFHTEAGTITNGQKVCVRHTSAATPGTAVNTTLRVGSSVMDVYTSTTLPAGEIDTTPEAFTFADADGVQPATVTTSDPVTIGGINSSTPISIEGGTYAIGDGAYTSAAGHVINGQVVRVRVTSSPDFAAVVNAALNVGGVVDTYSVTTRAANENHVDDPAGHNVDVTAPPGVTIDNLTNSATKPDGAPTGFFYPNGFFSFDVNGLTAGATTTVQIVLPPGSRPTGYLKCDGSHCERYPHVVIAGNTITLTLTDGGDGDSDHLANGVINDPGAPIADAPASGGGGALNPALLLGLGLLGLRRRRSRS